MLNVLRDTQQLFLEIQSLLESNIVRNRDYFARLGDTTQEAYVLMNKGMCVNTSICPQCADHSSFLHSLIPMLEDLENGKPLSADYETKLLLYKQKVTEIISRISEAISAL